MTSGPDSRFPMTLERPVHHPLWPLARFHGLAAALPAKGAPAGSPGNDAASRNRCLFWGGLAKAAAARRRGKKGKWRSSSPPRPATYSSFDALPPSISFPPQPFFITSPHSCPSDSYAPTNSSICGMPDDTITLFIKDISHHVLYAHRNTTTDNKRH